MRSVLAGVLAFALYAWLRQGVIYGDDAVWELLNVERGQLRQHVHLLHLPLLALLHRATEPLGFTLWESAALLSALGMAVGVAFVHAASERIGMKRRDAAAVTALAALLPPVMFFASLVEKHGPGFAFDGLAWFATAWLVARPRAGVACLLGAATGLAFLVHSFAGLLPAAVLPLFVALRYERGALRRADLPRHLALCALAGAVHAVIVLGVPRLLVPFGFQQSASGTVGFLRFLIAHIDDVPAAVVWTLRSEWVVPFFPVSLLWIAGFFRPAARPRALAVAVMLVPYLTLTLLMLSGLHIADYGAYMVSLAWPLALVVHASLPRAAFLAVVAISAATGLWLIADFDAPERPRAFAAGFREVTGGEPSFLIAGDTPDLEAIFIEMPAQPYELIGYWTMLPFEVEALRAPGLAKLDAVLAQHYAAGRRIFLTELAEQNLEHPDGRALRGSGEVILRHLRESYRLVPVHAQGFEGKEVLARP